MRVLLSSTRGAGHFAPLVPFARACARAGHEVLAAGPPALAGAVEAAGLDFWCFDPPDDEELGPVWEQVPTLSREDAERVVVGDIFGRLNTRAALPRLREACETWGPDLVLRETSEYASALAAELHGVSHARVATGLASTESMQLALAAPAVDAIRRDVGLPPDPGAETLGSSPFLTMFPEALEDPAEPAPARTLRFADPGWRDPPSPLPDWWDGAHGPLLYVSFGSVAGALEMAAGAYRAALEAMDGLEARVLLTVGREAELEAFGSAPPNVHVEPWVPQADVLSHAALVVCHGGSATTLGSLAAGRPLVVVPLFADQPVNAERVAAAGAGVAVAPEAGAIREATEWVLSEPGFGAAAAAIATELAAQQPADDAVSELERLAGAA
jgi:UDP:flavonoid glycosyltransferase YjiC (YdhE family)